MSTDARSMVRPRKRGLVVAALAAMGLSPLTATAQPAPVPVQPNPAAALPATTTVLPATATPAAATVPTSALIPLPAYTPGSVYPPPMPVSVSAWGGYTCRVGDHVGADNDDARTMADLMCNALAEHHARPGAYDIRVGKLGARLLLALTERSSGSERQVFLRTIDEIPVAGDRLAASLAENKPVKETLRADNAVSSDSAASEHRKVLTSTYVGLTGMWGVGGLTAAASAGVELDLDFRLQRIAMLLQARVGGIGSSDGKLSYTSMSAGFRYYFSDADIAAFAGGGLTLADLRSSQAGAADYDGSGFGACAEIGAVLLRSSHVGSVVSLRADVPMFALNQPAPLGGANVQYVAPISINVGLLFH